MNAWPRRIALVTATLAVSTVLAACTPAAMSGASAPITTIVTFFVETYDADGLPTSRKVAISLTAYQADGAVAVYTDPRTGQLLPGPLKLESESTPWSYPQALQLGVVGASLRAVYLGRDGDRVHCWYEINGVRDDDSENVGIVPRGPINTLGIATADCIY